MLSLAKLPSRFLGSERADGHEPCRDWLIRFMAQICLTYRLSIVWEPDREAGVRLKRIDRFAPARSYPVLFDATEPASKPKNF